MKKTVAYKNPQGILGQEDEPLLLLDHILYSDQSETYDNVCWFDCGAWFRCKHAFHRTQENAHDCDEYVEGAMIGKVLEER